MRLEELRQTIIESDREHDWHDIITGTYFSEVPDVDNDTFEWHQSMIVYKEDVDLSIQWGMDARGMDHVKTADQIWREHGHFPDMEARVELADVFWRGALVDRVQLVVVDGGRALLPIGDQRALNFDHAAAPGNQEIKWEYSATHFEIGVARLLDGGGEFDRYFGQTTMIVK